MSIRVRPSVVRLGLAVAVITGAWLIPSEAFASSTASSVLNAAKAAIAKQTGVRLVLSTSGSGPETVVADLGINDGEETISSGGANATIKVTSSYGYLQGNSTGLTSIIDLSSAQAKKLGQKWMSVKAGTSQYSDLKSGLTFAAITSALPAAKGATLSMTKTNGVEVYVLKWTTAATSSTPKLQNTVSIAATGAALPVEQIGSSSTGSGTTKFSMWGEHVVVTSPSASSTVSYSTVVG